MTTSYDTIVIGAGSAGAALTARLVDAGQTVLLLEAGPDYGPFYDGAWPSELLDHRALPTTHQWGYDSGATYPGRTLAFERAKVVGGCSAHNGCAAIWGSRVDYDAWADAGLDGWSTDDLLPYFREANVRLRVRNYESDAITPFHRAWLNALPKIGIPVVDDLNDLDEDTGIAPFPLNVADSARWNTGFAFLDPLRDDERLTIQADALVDRLRLSGDRADAVVAIVDGEVIEYEAERVVVAAGAYGSPAILQRSGIGHPLDLSSVGVQAQHALPGVGRNLHDHPTIVLAFEGTDEMCNATREFAREVECPEEQTIAKARSRHCAEAFDLHLCPIGGFFPGTTDDFRWTVMIGNMAPLSRGAVSVASADPSAAPDIDHSFLSDPEGSDVAVLIDGVRLVRDAARTGLRELGAEHDGSASAQSDAELEALVKAQVSHYYHPVGSCKMALAEDRDAVVDAQGRVHGLENVYVGDCSIMPAVPRANTAIPAIVVGLRVGDAIIGRAGLGTGESETTTEGSAWKR